MSTAPFSLPSLCETHGLVSVVQVFTPRDTATGIPHVQPWFISASRGGGVHVIATATTEIGAHEALAKQLDALDAVIAKHKER
ncbi:hypothetical protein [Novosphingobium sp. FKTRR1]|uniref:hypothetical protein n=1 Tax=Novosphingobium sp. FKTRR1 TaxID=2879118 RepID=UPI001CEFBD46|nr:hypothetical protein [Novosphingobium sp. FKTRR1]